mmetsp:Transcript_23982/g.66618  ORF Transcript_23982/g.66618 Transcript_23982/m.66618 type:complete len:126 (-) Transcript_23982:1912-2289(-)
MNKGTGVGLLALLVLVIFSVNKVYENHHKLSTPLILEVDEVELVMVKPPPANNKLTLPPDNLVRSAKRYLPEGLFQQFQEQFNPWLGPQKKIVTRRAVVYAKKVTADGEEGPLSRRALRTLLGRL